ncbi:MAG: hypothetical protein CVU31_04475 [Betaproteobacteria bacterium HGW-Betaproteobacteria-4]|nr:MAG: hypothetical protein CVU31_04475 [Betaproteobacteria bacterium HGW-Betaproteobacteria-4]
MSQEAANLPRCLQRLKGKEETMVAHKVASRVVASDYMPSLPGGEWSGIPATYLYLFGVWAGLIALAAWVAERRGP